MAAGALALLSVAPPAAAAGAATLTLRQGTDLTVAAAPDGTLVMDLAGRLWRLPAEGGSAVSLTAAGEIARRPAFSPDGRALAYQVLREGRFHVVVADADGAHPRQVTRGEANHVGPAWSADGRRLALASDRTGDFAVWALEPDSGALTQLSFEPGDEFDPAWEPGGSAIAYVHTLGDRHALVVRRPGAAPRTLVGNGRLLRAPSWRPDGSVITYATGDPRGARLSMVILSDPPVVKPFANGEAPGAGPVAWLDRQRTVYAADGGIRRRDFGALTSVAVPFEAALEVRAVAPPPPRALPLAADNRSVRGLAGIAVLPDGRVIASALGDLWEFGPDGALLRALTQDAYVDRDPAASADGGQLAFTSDRDGRPQVWIMDLATRESRRLTDEPVSAGRPAWSARGDRLAYLAAGATREAGLALRVVPAGGGAPLEVAAGLVAPGTPAWSPGDERVAVVETTGGVARLVTFPPDGAPGTRRVTLAAGAVGPGVNEAQWSGDGRSLLVASAAGVRALPVLGGGLVGAEWRPVAEGPAQSARWVPGTADVLFTDADGLARASGGTTARVPLPLSWRAAQPAARIVIRASRVFDGTSDHYLYDHDVIVEDGRIVAVAPRSAAEPAAGSVLLDATGRTVLPGLLDLSLALPDIAGEGLGRALLAWGITTAQVGGTGGAGLREVAERWEAHAAGPRLLRYADLCGRSPDAADGAVATGAVRVCAGTGQTPALLASLPPPQPAVWSPHWLAATTGLVHAIEPRTAPGAGPLPPVLTGRDLLYQDAIDVVVHSGAVLVTDVAAVALPALVDRHPGLLESEAWRALVPESGRTALAEAWEARRQRDGAWLAGWLRDQQRVLGRIAAGGGRLAPSGGAPLAPYGLGLHAELRVLADAGLPRPAVLRAATAEAARALGLDAELGTLQAGRLADVLVVAGDPLADLDALLAVEVVVTGGRIRPRSALVPEPALEKFTPPPPRSPPKAGRSRR